MTTTPVTDNAQRFSGLARKLVIDGLLSEEQARQAHDEAIKKHTSIVAQLVESKTLDAYTIAETGAKEFGVPLFDITTIDMDVLAAKSVEEKLIRKHHALPLFKSGNRLYVAVAAPTNMQALDEIKSQSATRATWRSTTLPSSASSTRYCSTPSTAAPPISISNPTKRIIACASGKTVCCVKSRVHRSGLLTNYPRA